VAAPSALPEPKQDDSRAPALLRIDKSLVVRASPRPVRTERWDRLKVWWVKDSGALAGIALMREDVSAVWPGQGGLRTAFMRHVPTDAHSYERLWRYVEAGSAAVVVRDFNYDRKKMQEDIPRGHTIGAVRTQADALLALDMAARLAAAKAQAPNGALGWIKRRLGRRPAG
jgi:hypothetical protein